MVTSPNSAAQESATVFGVSLGMTTIETYKKMKTVLKYKNISRALVYKRHYRLSDSWMEALRLHLLPLKDHSQGQKFKDLNDLKLQTLTFN